MGHLRKCWVRDIEHYLGCTMHSFEQAAKHGKVENADEIREHLAAVKELLTEDE